MNSDFAKSVYQLKNGMWGYRYCVRVDGKNVYKRVSKDRNGMPCNFRRTSHAVTAI